MGTFVSDFSGLRLYALPSALGRRNLTEALSIAAELEHVGLAEALELCLMLRDKAPER